METEIVNFLGARDKFIGHLEDDIAKNDQALAESTEEKNELNSLIENIKSLGKYPERESLIPLAKNIYMKGRIIHTGEYHEKLTAYPDSYVVLKTSDQTISSLESRLKSKETDIENVEYAKLQLGERMKILKGEICTGAKDDLPQEIRSEKGVAVKVGEFYEILEFEEK